MMIQIDTGDTVFHRPSRETWLVACVRGDQLSWLGWPEGMAELSDCLLVEKAMPAERGKLLEKLASSRNQYDHRCRYAKRVLARAQEAEQQYADLSWEPVYRGENGHDVTVNGGPLDPRLDLVNHSPTGFSWGYGGSGPAQLALAILAHHLKDDQRALQLYQEFKWQVIAQLGHKWELPNCYIAGWVRGRELIAYPQERALNPDGEAG